MDMYHGTNSVAASAIAKKVEVNLGGGELGQGFYAGESIALAAAWSQGRFNKDAKVVKVKLPDSDFVKLRIKQVGHFGYLRQLWRKLKTTHATKTFKFGADVVVAPFATLSFSYQYKFESPNAETVLNSSATRTVL